MAKGCRIIRGCSHHLFSNAAFCHSDFGRSSDQTFIDISRFRADVIPLVDGDKSGDGYIESLEQRDVSPGEGNSIWRWGRSRVSGWWILQPAIAAPGPGLSTLLGSSRRDLKNLQDALAARKDDRQLRENLCWEALDNRSCECRHGNFLEDLASIAAGSPPKDPQWVSATRSSGLKVFTARHIASA